MHFMTQMNYQVIALPLILFPETVFSVGFFSSVFVFSNMHGVQFVLERAGQWSWTGVQAVVLSIPRGIHTNI